MAECLADPLDASRSVQACGAIIKFGSHCGLDGTTKRGRTEGRRARGKIFDSARRSRYQRTTRAYNGATDYAQFTYLKDDAVQNRRTVHLAEEAVLLYGSGVTIKEVAKQFQVSQAVVQERFKEMGVRIRPRDVKYAPLADKSWLEAQYRVERNECEGSRESGRVQCLDGALPSLQVRNPSKETETRAKRLDAHRARFRTGLSVGPSGFEPESSGPEPPRIDQATPRTQREPP